MKKLKIAGFFKELPYGSKIGLSIKEKKDNFENLDEIIAYINNGFILIMSPGISFDFFKPEKIIGSGPNILTDGEWAWPSDLSYYLKEYNTKIEDEFISYMKMNNWQIKNRNIINLNELKFIIDN